MIRPATIAAGRWDNGALCVHGALFMLKNDHFAKTGSGQTERESTHIKAGRRVAAAASTLTSTGATLASSQRRSWASSPPSLVRAHLGCAHLVQSLCVCPEAVSAHLRLVDLNTSR
eukprot:COSAG06_NODE_9175_length_1967_cov_5.091481_1_plen_116_part_00